VLAADEGETKEIYTWSVLNNDITLIERETSLDDDSQPFSKVIEGKNGSEWLIFNVYKSGDNYAEVEVLAEDKKSHYKLTVPREIQIIKDALSSSQYQKFINEVTVERYNPKEENWKIKIYQSVLKKIVLDKHQCSASSSGEDETPELVLSPPGSSQTPTTPSIIASSPSPTTPSPTAPSSSPPHSPTVFTF